MPKPMRFYLQMNSCDYRSFAWIQNNKSNEMLLGFYGQNDSQSTLERMWPVQELSSEAANSARYEYRDAVEVGSRVDHVTCHSDGRFHVKAAGGATVYNHTMQRTESLDADTSTFLDVSVLSDLVQHYKLTTPKPKSPYAWAEVPEDCFVRLRFLFSGINYDLEGEVAAIAAGQSSASYGVRLVSGTLKGIVIAAAEAIGHDAKEARPRGTIASFRFPLADDKWHHKTFLFS